MSDVDAISVLRALNPLIAEAAARSVMAIKCYSSALVNAGALEPGERQDAALAAVKAIEAIEALHTAAVAAFTEAAVALDQLAALWMLSRIVACARTDIFGGAGTLAHAGTR